MDYGKYKYEAAQKAKESRRKTSNVVIKEMKYRPKIGGGDFDTKTRKVEHFLAEGHKVKVTLTFRGREVSHPELGRKILDQVEEAVKDVGRVEIFPRIDGRNMTMVLAPGQAGPGRQAEGRRGCRGRSGRGRGRRGPDADTDAAEAIDDPEITEDVTETSPRRTTRPARPEARRPPDEERSQCPR